MVKHPAEYALSWFNEIQSSPKPYTVADRLILLDFFPVGDKEHFCEEHRHWVERELQADVKKREKIQRQLGSRARGRSIIPGDEGTALKAPQAPYSVLFEGEKGALRLKNSYYWNVTI